MMDPLQLASLLTTPLAHLTHPAPMASPPPAKKQRKKSPSPAATASVVKREEDLDDEASLAEEDKVKRAAREKGIFTDIAVSLLYFFFL
jgi:hypothetical protein